MKEAHIDRRLFWLIVLLFWVIGIVVWWAALWHLDLFMNFLNSGANLPTSTIFVGEAVHSGVPFVIAALFSAVAIYTMLRHRGRALSLSAWLLCISIALSLGTMGAMTLPMVKLCGEFVPRWTSTFEVAGPRSLNELVRLRTELKCGAF